MNPQLGYFFLTLSVAVAATAIAGIAWLCATVGRLNGENLVLRREAAEQRASIARLATSLTETDDRMTGVDRRYRAMDLRLGRLEQRDLDNRRYSEAARLVRNGAAPENLVKNCGLTSGEADLVARMHGLKKSA